MHGNDRGDSRRRWAFAFRGLAAVATIAALVAIPGEAPAAAPPNPVIFIHGLTGSADRTWADALAFFASQPGWGPAAVIMASDASVTPGNLYALNFSDFDQSYPSQNLTFAQQGGEVAMAVALVLAANPGADRVILVAHSMGGDAARNYVEGLAEIGGQPVGYAGDVAAVITIGTPHMGSPLADTCHDFGFLCDSFIALFNPPLSLSSVAMNSLRTNSADVTALNSTAAVAALPADVVYWSVVGGGQTFPVLLETDSDRVVPVTSQDLANVPGTAGLMLMRTDLDYSYLDATGGIGHLEEGHDPRFFDEVLSLVDVLSVCGNGVVEGSETCDDGNVVDADGCSSNCTIEQCGDPVASSTAVTGSIDPQPTTNAVTASDALLVLRAAVGGQSCALCVCDVNDDGVVTATDALIVLKTAVGTGGALLCPAC
jgi:cysteine-rich repeat protein